MIQANINNRWAQLSQGEKAELLGIYTRAGYNDLAGIIAHYNSCGGKLKADGGPVINTAQYKSDAYLYNPPVNVWAPIEAPLRYKPLPDYGDYEPQRTTGMLEDIPIEIGLGAPQIGYGVLMPDASSTTSTLDARQDAARRIMAVENSKNNVNGGYDAKTGRWYPHKSHEGGTDTIAYGIKLSNGTPEAALALKQGYLTDEQAVSAVDSLVQKYYDAAKKVYDGKYGAGEWDKLSDKSQSILVDYSYNPGLAKFPKLMEGFHSGNLDLIRKNYKRYVNGKELGRNKVLLEELDTLENEYPIFRANGGRIHIPNWTVFGTDYSTWKPSDIQNIIDWGYTDPESFFGEEGESTRNALSRAGMADSVIGDIYANMDPELQSKFGDRYKGTKQRQQEYTGGITNAIDSAGQRIYQIADTVAGFVPGPVGMIDWLGHMGADVAEGEFGKVGKDLALAAGLGFGARALGKGARYLKNYWDEIGNFGEDTFSAFTDKVPGRVSTNFTYLAPAARASMETVPVVERAVSAPYEIENLGGGYMLKSLMRGNPLEKQISKNGTVNVNNVRALVGKGSKVEQAVVDKVLASEEFAGKKSIDYNKFRKAVQDELITYDRTPNTKWSDYGLDRIGLSFGNKTDVRNAEDRMNMLRERIATGRFSNGEKLTESDITDAKSELKKMEAFWKQIPETETYTFSSSRIPNGSAKHYDANTLGHSRTYTTADEPDVLHVMESQSDWGQQRGQLAPKNAPVNISEENFKAFLEKHPELEFIYYKNANELSPGWSAAVKGLEKEYPDILQYINKTPLKDVADARQMHYLSDNFTSRQIQENLRYAAEKGQTKMRYPTKETAAKIEGYPKETNYYDTDGNLVTDSRKIYTIGKENEKELDLIQRELDGYYAKFNVAQLPNGDYVPAGNYSDNPYQQLIEAIPRKQAAYDGWRASHPNATSEKGQRIVDDMKRKAEEIKNFRMRVKYLNQRMKELKSIKPYIDPSIKKEVKYMHEDDILRKYNEFPKQFKKLYKGVDVRVVTDPKGNTWYEVDVPENYLKQEWAYKNGGKLQQYADFSGFF